MVAPQRKTARLNGIDLSYLEWAIASTPAQIPPPSRSGDPTSVASPLPVSDSHHPVLLLHGLADHAGIWQHLGSHLGLTHSVVAPDLRGHGDSSKPEQGYAYTDIIADLTALMDHLGWPSAHIVGHSWSGKIACIWATQNSERFKSLVLIDPAFTGRFPRWTRITFPLFYRILPFLKTMGPFTHYDEAEQQAKTLKQYQGWSSFQETVFKDSMMQQPDGSWQSKFCVAARDGVFDDFTQVAALTAPITVPTLFVRPEQGLNPRSFQLKPYRTFIEPLKIQSVPGNHWAFLVNPEPTNQIVSRFLRTIES